MKTVDSAEVGLERDVFMRSLVRELAGSLEGVVGLQEASGYISIVGGAIGERIDSSYRKALNVDRLSRDQVTDVLVDLKRRIQGDFFVVEETEDKIVLGNRRCPFGEMVKDRPSLCMMTSNVFGYIARAKPRICRGGTKGNDRTWPSWLHGGRAPEARGKFAGGVA
jgi:hypothetical protein